MCVHMYVHLYDICMYIYRSVHTCAYVCTSIVRMHVNLHKHMRVYTDYMRVYTDYMQVSILSYVFRGNETYICICMCMKKSMYSHPYSCRFFLCEATTCMCTCM